MLERVRLTTTAIGRQIVLARFGKDPTLALEKKDATNDFWQTLVSYAFDGRMPEPGEAAEIEFGGGDEQFTVTVRRNPVPAGEPHEQE